jgi:hypothetical protein
MINYSITTNAQGVTVVQSSVESNSLTHVTEKDLVSFYLRISQNAFLDTGLLPVDGTGLLAYRQASNHAQIVVQRSPSVNRIIWGITERDPNAKEIYVAQPYQIYIGDILDDNFYGARIFYSPNPITNPNDPLYHTNLPNTNCNGYRGNGVGWVCLYHTDSWKNLPIGEKMARLIERCSGSEAFNDNNMSETDGTRFYRQHHNERNPHLWDPIKWQEKTEREGIDWVTHPDTWIPVLVKGIDSQSQHEPDGVPLTIGMALTGNYASYYQDTYLPKPVNAIVRQMDSSNINVMNLIKKAYVNASSVTAISYKPQDPYTYAVEVREKNVQSLSKLKKEKQQEEYTVCKFCESTIETDESLVGLDNEVLCSECFNENYVVLEDGSVYSKEDCIWFEAFTCWVHANEVVYCDCEAPYMTDVGTSKFSHWVVFDPDNGNSMCVSCCMSEPESFSKENDPQIVKCLVTDIPFPANPKYGFECVVVPYFDDSGNIVNGYVSKPYYYALNYWNCITPCPCGRLAKNSHQSELFLPASPESLPDIDHRTKIPIEIINPCVEVNQHLGVSTEMDLSGNYAYGWACAGCCVYDKQMAVYRWDPQSIDYAVYDLDNLRTIHLVNSLNQMKSGINK